MVFAYTLTGAVDQELEDRIERQPGDGPFPLSFAQQRLWFLDQLQPGSAWYLTPRPLRITGALHFEALRHALREMVRRHGTLRTRFFAVDGSPLQVTEDVELPVPFLDLSKLERTERSHLVETMIATEAKTPLDLAKPPLVRALVLRLSGKEHLVILTLHHIASDGWSNAVVVSEIGELYRSYRDRRTSSLPDLPLRYVDFAVWQRRQMQGPLLERHLAYWRAKLDAIAILDLPTDKPRPSFQSFKGAHISTVIPASLTERVLALSSRAEVTLFMCLLGAFQLLLAGYTGQTDVAVGTPIANRQRVELEALIGFFVNTIVLRTDLTGDPTFAEVMRRTFAVTIEAYAHQNAPFEKLVDELQPTRDMGRTPFFQVMFTLQNSPVAPLDLGDCEVALIDADSGTSKFDLSLDIIPSPQGMVALLEYNTDLFDQSASLILKHYVQLLSAVASDPNLRLSELPPFARHATSLNHTFSQGG
jgi:hypothetical protein